MFVKVNVWCQCHHYIVNKMHCWSIPWFHSLLCIEFYFPWSNSYLFCLLCSLYLNASVTDLQTTFHNYKLPLKNIKNHHRSYLMCFLFENIPSGVLYPAQIWEAGSPNSMQSCLPGLSSFHFGWRCFANYSTNPLFLKIYFTLLMPYLILVECLFQ